MKFSSRLLLLFILTVSTAVAQRAGDDPRYQELNRLANKLKRTAWEYAPSQQTLSEVENLLRRGIRKLKGNINPAPIYGPTVQVYRSDSCNGSLVMNLRADTDCSTVSGSAWAVRIGNGACKDIQDTSVGNVCKNLKAYQYSEKVVEVYKSDRCSGGFVAAFSAQTNCNELGSGQAWAVKIDGQCQDISDTSLKNACTNFKASTDFGPKLSVYKSDSCSGQLVGVISRRTSCQSLVNTSGAWAIKLSGDSCQDISDTSLVTACNRFAP
jgi:hypothetical protein